METSATAPTSSDTESSKEKLQLPKERTFLIPIRYKEPKAPLINRADRRMIRKLLLETCAKEIDKHLREFGPIYGRASS